MGTICRTPYCKVLSSSFVKGVFLVVCPHPQVHVLESHVTVSCLTRLPATSQCLHAQLLNTQPSLSPAYAVIFLFVLEIGRVSDSSSLCWGSPETYFQWFLVTLEPQQRVTCIALWFTTAEESRPKSGKGMGAGWSLQESRHQLPRSLFYQDTLHVPSSRLW